MTEIDDFDKKITNHWEYNVLKTIVHQIQKAAENAKHCNDCIY